MKMKMKKKAEKGEKNLSTEKTHKKPNSDEKIEKKRKATDTDSDENSELVEPMNPEVNESSKRTKKKKKKMDLIDNDEQDEVLIKSEDPNSVSNFRISESLRNTLKSNGIETLFPIQAMTFNTILNGSDLVGRARTGQGKTLAFVLPILESLTKNTRKTGYGRTPSVLVLLPTRELATQVAADFDVYGLSLGLTSCCLYGGVQYRDQTYDLKRGVDIVVGTPGRIKDHIEKGNIDFSSLKFRVLDEADEMLKLNFVADVEFILGKVEDPKKVQTLLFSATLPSWVKNISMNFLKPDKKTVDIVGDEKMMASMNVRHIVLPCSKAARTQVIPDVIRFYSSGGRTMIFVERKIQASELTGLLPGSCTLHGDIQQSQREIILKGFRLGKFLTLVATDVAARGLDINDVQLVIQCEPPGNVEAYVHRSGRTGRAGKTGVSVVLYDPRYSNSLSKIESDSGVKFERVTAPQPSDIAKAAGIEAVEKINQVSDNVISVFKSAAEKLLNETGLSAVEILAKALAKCSGYTEIKRSVLTSMENFVTVILEAGRIMYSPSFAFGVLRRFLPEEKVESVQGLVLTADRKGAVFDVCVDDLDMFLARSKNAADVSLEVVKKLPALQEKEQRSFHRFGGGRNGGGGGGGDRRSGGRGGGFSRGGRGGGGNQRRVPKKQY